MNQDKKIQVVMLATDRSELCIMVNHNEYKIGTDEENLFLQYSKDFSYGSSITDNSQSPQHLYFLSDDEIKEDDVKSTDWFINLKDNSLFQVLDDEMIVIKNVKKIITSTDKSLGLSEPSKEWIEYYISEYNKGNIITEVMVEYENDIEQNHKDLDKRRTIYDSLPDNYRLKVNPDSTINIKPVEDTWDDINYEYENFRYIHPQISFIEWLKENYQVPKQLKK